MLKAQQPRPAGGFHNPPYLIFPLTVGPLQSTTAARLKGFPHFRGGHREP